MEDKEKSSDLLDKKKIDDGLAQIPAIPTNTKIITKTHKIKQPKNKYKNKNEAYSFPIPSVTAEKVQRLLQHIQNTNSGNYPMHMNNPAMPIGIIVREVAYVKIMNLNPDMDMESFYRLPHVYERLQ